MKPPPTTRPRLLIEEWLPAPALGVECMRERSTGQRRTRWPSGAQRPAVSSSARPSTGAGKAGLQLLVAVRPAVGTAGWAQGLAS